MRSLSRIPINGSFYRRSGKSIGRGVEDVVRAAEGKGHVVGVRFAPEDDEANQSAPWMEPPSRHRREPAISGPLPETIDLVLGNEIYIPKDGLPSRASQSVHSLGRLSKSGVLQGASDAAADVRQAADRGLRQDHPQHIGLPRGCLDDLLALFKDLKIKSTIRDERTAGQPLSVVFQGELRPEQQTAAEAMLAHDTGVLSATTAFGKTVVAAWLIARRGVNTLVLVHRRQLQEQWVDRLSAFLGLPPKSIRPHRRRTKKPTGTIDVAVIQSLVRKGVVDDHRAELWTCHH